MTRTLQRSIWLAAALLTVAGCGSSTMQTGGAAVTPSPAGTLNVSGVMQWNAVLGAQNGSNLDGSAMVTSDGPNNRTVANVRLSGGTAGNVHPWHIHSGRCGESGGNIVGSPQAYSPLVIANDGTARAQAVLPMPIPSGAYSVIVHRSMSEMGTVVACGNLQ